MKILVVEDDTTSRSLLIKLVSKIGHEAIPAEDGERAWDILMASDPPRLILLDRMLPGIDGMELCRRLRSHKYEVSPYVIILTVKGEKSDIISGLEAGANDYISKPFDPDELRARIDVGERMVCLESSLAERISEKELLLHEVHHRLKNNMTTIGSILSLHADSISETAAVAALKDAKSRLLSMEILYDKLYRSDNVSEMSVADYLAMLIQKVVNQFSNRDSVTVENSISDILLPAKHLTTLGIIINELVTNTMKYAFPGDRKGRICTSALFEKSKIIISIEDDGIGIPESVNCETSSSFGLRLVGILTAQLGGMVKIERDHGTRFVIEFLI
jgi:two-component sensor histidine kinase